MIRFCEDFFRRWCFGSWCMLVCWIVLAGLLILLAVMFVDAVRIPKAVNRFFDKYEPNSGVIYDYDFDEASDTTITTPVCVGPATIMNTQFYNYPEKYFIRIECKNKGKHFLLKYQISGAEYKRGKIGSVVEIQPDWIRYGYCLLG